MIDEMGARQQMLAEARECLAAGRLDRADEVCRLVLSDDSAHAEALSLAGLIAHLRGAADEAIEFLKQAIAADPTQAQFHYNLGVVYQMRGLTDEAADSYRTALEIDPRSAQAHNNLGFALFKLGELDESVTVLKEAIRLEPAYPDAYNNLGLALAARGEIDRAVENYRRAIRLKPDLADAHYNLGLALAALGRSEAAADCYRKTLEIQPEHAEARRGLALLLAKVRASGAIEALEEAAAAYPDDAALADALGNTYARVKELEKAVEWYRTAVRLKPDHAAYHNNLGFGLKQLEKLDEALEAFQHALQLCPDLTEAQANVGRIYAQQRRYEEATNAFERALQIDSHHAGARCALANVLSEQRRWEDAIAVLKELLGRDPNNIIGQTLLGNAYTELKRFEQAERAYRDVIAGEPTNAIARSNLANVLTLTGRPDQAEGECRLALALQPDYPQALHNLAIALGALGRSDEAVACRREALRLKEDYPEVEMSMAFDILKQEDFEEGWRSYESRWKLRQFVKPNYTQPEWDGVPLAGRTIVLYAEQGLGDTLQFIRYAPLVQKRGGKVAVICQTALTKLLGSAPGINFLIANGQPLPPFDFQLPLLSVPRVLQTTLDTIPRDVPYLFADPALVEHWKRELAGIDGFRIAIAWQGNPTYVGDKLRSVPLRYFAALAQVPGVRLLSIQKGFGREQLGDVVDRFEVLDLADRLDVSTGAFMDTAAVMKSVDLVVTSDSALAHLAGALGVPTWLATSLSADWRWLEGREDSPWYPSMRLFRQRRLKGWDEVFRRMAEELDAVVERRSDCSPNPLHKRERNAAASSDARGSNGCFTVSVVTPWRDHPELIADYERAIRGAQVIVVDNGSAPEAAAEIRAMVDRLDGVYLRNEQNAGFAAANNQGLAHATGAIILFLNNDIAAGPEFLECVQRDVKPGMLAGAATKTQIVYGLRLRYLDGWCIAGYREVFDRLMGWDAEAFPEPFWEDNDLCFRATQAGIVLQQFTWPVEHKGGKTHGLVVCWGDVYERNRARFAERVRPYYLQKRAEAETATGSRLPIVATKAVTSAEGGATERTVIVNLSCCISNVGYGVVGLNVLKSLERAGHSVACWPLGAFEPPANEAELVRKALDRQTAQRNSAPSLRIFCQGMLKEHFGSPRIGFPIFELTRFTDEEKSHLREQDLLLVASQWARRVVESNSIFNGRDALRVARLGVDRAIFCESPCAAEKALSRTTTIFLAVGKWERRKGHDLLLEAFGKAFSIRDDVELWMLVENPVVLSTVKATVAIKQDWEARYRCCPLAEKIKLLPWQATQREVADVMRQADCGVFLSRAEGWNLPALEMLSSGKHIIITDYSAHTEYCDESNARLIDIDALEDAHDGCYFFGQGQWASLGERQLEQAINHLREVHLAKQDGRLRLNQAGIETAKRLSWDACAAGILAAIRELSPGLT